MNGVYVHVPSLTLSLLHHSLSPRIHYDNPKIVTGAVVTYEPEGASEPLFLLCRRAIPPRKGFLNLPAGYMERGESLVAAAMREAREEATAQIEVGGPRKRVCAWDFRVEVL